MARSEVDSLRDRVFRLMMEMGPAAEAYHWSISPALNRPKTVTPWHQISLKKLRKVKKTSKQALKQALEAKAEISAAKAEMEALKMENLCLKLKYLKISTFFCFFLQFPSFYFFVNSKYIFQRVNKEMRRVATLNH